MSHTPAPWSVDGSNVRASGNGYSVARINFPSYRGKEGREDRNVCRANARLIAAAPDLLAALKAAVKNSDDLEAAGHMRDRSLWPIYENAVAAIAKAEGGQ